MQANDFPEPANAVVSRFTMIGGSIVVLEAILGTWPIVATALWGSHAVDTWIHFLYWIKGFFLFLAVIQTRWSPERFAKGMTNPTPRSLTFFELCVGATVSCELSTWMLISIVAHALLSSIVLLLVLVLRREFLSNTQWVLSVVFDGVAIIESIGSPMVLTTFGLGPVMQVPPASLARTRTAPDRPRYLKEVHMDDYDDEIPFPGEPDYDLEGIPESPPLLYTPPNKRATFQPTMARKPRASARRQRARVWDKAYGL